MESVTADPEWQRPSSNPFKNFEVDEITLNEMNNKVCGVFNLFQLKQADELISNYMEVLNERIIRGKPMGSKQSSPVYVNVPGPIWTKVEVNALPRDELQERDAYKKLQRRDMYPLVEGTHVRYAKKHRTGSWIKEVTSFIPEDLKTPLYTDVSPLFKTQDTKHQDQRIETQNAPRKLSTLVTQCGEGYSRNQYAKNSHIMKHVVFDAVWSLRYVYDHLLKNMLLFLQFLECFKLIKPRPESPCGKAYTLQTNNYKLIGYFWKCCNGCPIINVLEGSFFGLNSEVFMEYIIVSLLYPKLTVLDKTKLLNISRSLINKYNSTMNFIYSNYVQKHVIQNKLKLRGVIEIDETIFGRRVKYHRGKSTSKRGSTWVLGLVERGSGRVILYNILRRDSFTLQTIIKRHVEVGSTIFTDGWKGYGDLNKLGYRHFSVLHIKHYTQRYTRESDGYILTVHTNTIEGGVWSKLKQFVLQRRGHRDNFEICLAEFMFRSHFTQNELFVEFCKIMSNIVQSEEPAYVTLPIFTPIVKEMNLENEHDVEVEVDCNDNEWLTPDNASATPNEKVKSNLIKYVKTGVLSVDEIRYKTRSHTKACLQHNNSLKHNSNLHYPVGWVPMKHTKPNRRSKNHVRYVSKKI